MKFTEAVKLLENAGIENARGEARQIFMHFGGYDAASLMLTDAYSDDVEVQNAVERRILREPLQYILGTTYFANEVYHVTPDCLIPRPDTEILVEYARANIPSGEHFIDLCTGSGCVAISTLTGTKNTTCEAVDISVGALDLATKNATLNGVADRIEFIRADALSMPLGKDKPYAVLSNPPYVTEAEYSALEKELYFEPKIALVGADEGLEFYKGIVPLYKNRIKDDGFIAFEIGKDQAAALTAISAEEGMQIEIIKDYQGHDRVAVLSQQQPKSNTF